MEQEGAGRGRRAPRPRPERNRRSPSANAPTTFSEAMNASTVTLGEKGSIIKTRATTEAKDLADNRPRSCEFAIRE